MTERRTAFVQQLSNFLGRARRLTVHGQDKRPCVEGSHCSMCKSKQASHSSPSKLYLTCPTVALQMLCLCWSRSTCPTIICTFSATITPENSLATGKVVLTHRYISSDVKPSSSGEDLPYKKFSLKLRDAIHGLFNKAPLHAPATCHGVPPD